VVLFLDIPERNWEAAPLVALLLQILPFAVKAVVDRAVSEVVRSNDSVLAAFFV
jgi:hypothetical protein